MTRLFFYSILFIVFTTPTFGYDMVALRNQLYHAHQDRAVAADFIAEFENKNTGNNPLLTGYKAMAYMLWANYSWNPVHKFAYFKKGRKILDEAIKMDKQNVELRYLRYAIQTNVPPFLGYTENRNEDRQLMVTALEHIQDPDLKHRIRKYLNN